MKTYILSSDMFFLQGMANVLLKDKRKFEAVCFSNFSLSKLSEVIDNDCMVLIDFDINGFKHSSFDVYKKMQQHGVCIIPVIDVPLRQQFDTLKEIPYVPKRAGEADFMAALRWVEKSYRYRIPLLSMYEQYIMKEFVSGTPPFRVSKKIGRSVQTISGHKRNAMQKLGLRSLNIASFLWLKEMFNTHPHSQVFSRLRDN